MSGIEKKITVLGAGSWGTTLANHLARAGHPVTLWMIEKELPAIIRETGENKTFLPEIKLSDNIRPTNDLAEAVKGATLIVSVIPSHGVRSVFKDASAYLAGDVVIASATKGIENETTLSPSGILSEFGLNNTVVLSGPTFAREAAAGLPCAIVAASRDARASRSVQKLFSTGSLRVYTNSDVIGVETGGAIKNVIAIASGISDALGLGTNARAALITRGLSEMARLGVKLGAREETFAGLSGLGDLVLTCTGPLSRNRTVGLKIGEGQTLDEVTAEMRMVAEGVKTSSAVFDLAGRLGVPMPITEEVKAVLYDGKQPKKAVMDLMTRELTEE